MSRKVKFAAPVAGIHGSISSKDSVYVRCVRGKYILQSKPNREGHVKTEKERQNQQKFGKRYAGNKNHPNLKNQVYDDNL